MKLLSTLLKHSLDRNTLLIITILTLSIILRLIGIGVGLPATPDPRETLIANDVINLINFSAFPEIFNWPGTAWFHLIALIGKLLDFFGMDLTESHIILIGRFINVCLSTLTVWLTYCLGTKCYNRHVGLIAAAFLAVAMLHATNESRFALVDIPATLCVTLFLWLIARDTELRNRTCIYLGIVVGIGLAVKYPTAFVCLSLLIFINTADVYRKYATIILSAVITFTIVCPYWLIDAFSSDWNKFYSDFSYETTHYHKGHFGLFATGDTGLVNRYLHLWHILKWGLGLPLAMLVSLGLLFSIAGLSLSVKRSGLRSLFNDQRSRMVLILISFAIPFLICVGTFKVTFARHLLILYPSLTILAAAFLFTIGKRYGTVIGSLVWMYSFIYTVAFASVMLAQPTTEQVSEWVSDNIEADRSIAQAPEILFDWLLPELDRDMTDFDENTEWLIIIEANREVFQKYKLQPGKYQSQDWYPLENVEIEDNLAFYDAIDGNGSSYHLYKTFNQSPHFLGFRISDDGAPFPMRALLHPTIHLYQRKK